MASLRERSELFFARCSSNMRVQVKAVGITPSTDLSSLITQDMLSSGTVDSAPSVICEASENGLFYGVLAVPNSLVLSWYATLLIVGAITQSYQMQEPS